MIKFKLLIRLIIQEEYEWYILFKLMQSTRFGNAYITCNNNKIKILLTVLSGIIILK